MGTGSARRDAGANGSGGRAASQRTRPVLVALAEAQPLPALLFDADGSLIACNSLARCLCLPEPGEDVRVRADDGTDLWTIIAGRCDEAEPLFDIRVSLRTTSGETTGVSLVVAPLRGSGGMLAGALAFVSGAPADHARELPGAPEAGRERAPLSSFSDIVEYVGRLTQADFVMIAELDPDDPREAGSLATWQRQPLEAPGAEASAAIASALAGELRGRRFVQIDDRSSDALASDPYCTEHALTTGVLTGLVAEDGRRVGMLSVLWRAAPESVTDIAAVVAIVGATAAGLLSRLVTERELKESEQRYGAVFEGSSIPILLVEPGTTQIVDANPSACEFYGYPREELVTMSVLQIDALPPETAHAETARAAAGARTRFSGRHRAADGLTREVEVNTGTILVGGKRLVYSMVHDVTERLRMEAQLERHQRTLEQVVSQRTRDLLRVNAELQHATMARDMIFANLTQEMRTSLQTITGFSGLLLGGMAGELNDEQRRQTDMIMEAGRRLSSFIESFIETSRADESDMVCEPEEFDVVALIESVIFGLNTFAADKGLALTMVAEDRPLEVESDRYRLQKVLLNLLSNAIRYTERGSVTVTVSRDADGCGRIAVADTGVGIDQARMATMFDGPDLHEPSAGIGLPASKRIAAAIGATITAESVPGRGSVFTLALPLRCCGSDPSED